MSGTTKDQIARELLTVEILCDLAAMSIRSFMPIGLGEWYSKEHDIIIAMLETAPARFEKAIHKAQKTGWAAE